VDAGIQGPPGVFVTLSGRDRHDPGSWKFRQDLPRQIFSRHIRQ